MITMSLEKLLKRSLLGLSTLIISCGSEENDSGCQSDFDCKGNRYCLEYGSCYTPLQPAELTCPVDCGESCFFIYDNFDGLNISEELKVYSGNYTMKGGNFELSLPGIVWSRTSLLGEQEAYVIRLGVKGTPGSGLRLQHAGGKDKLHCMFGSEPYISENNYAGFRFHPATFTCITKNEQKEEKVFGSFKLGFADSYKLELVITEEKVRIKIDGLERGTLPIDALGKMHQIGIVCDDLNGEVTTNCMFEYIYWERVCN